MSSGQRVDVSTLQVVASVLAAVTGALAASFLGVAGTIIGTALMSVAGTVVAAVYRYFLDRGHERIRSAASDKIAPLARDSAAAAALSQHYGTTQLNQTEPGSRAQRADDAETQVFPAFGDGWAGRQSHTRTQTSTSATGRHNGSPADTVTGLGSRGPGGWGPGDYDAKAAVGREGPWQDILAWLRSSTRNGRPRWRNLAGAALVVFVIAMAGITAIEVFAGKPLAAVVSNRPGSGTSIIGHVGGSTTTPRHGSHPVPGTGSSTSPASSGPSATPSPSSSPSASPTASPTQSPSAGQSASPTPTSSPSPAATRAATGAPTPGPAAAATPAG